nr:MAG TPA: portal protein [Crassvirales sp.]
MRSEFQMFDFPQQRVPNSRKKEADWYAACCDWVIAQGQNNRDSSQLEIKYGILQGKIPDEFYKKILNPYNATNEKYTRFPATMRNYDLMKGIIRRYVSEYIKNPHDFIVGANNAEVVLARNAKLRQELAIIVQQKIAARIQQSYQDWINGGNDSQQFNPQTALDVEAFVQEFNESYIDDISAQGQQILNVIKDITEDALFYARAYFDFVTFGETYTYTDIVGNKIVKRVVSPRDAFPVNTDNIFREDDDMFAERRKLTYQQIVDEFDEYLDDKQREFLETYYAKRSANAPVELAFNVYESYFPDVCKKYSKEDRELFKKEPNMMRDNNPDLYDVWHVVWRGEVRRCIVTYVNEIGLIDTRIEEDDYELSPSTGDISLDYIYEPQVYECTRIGTRNDAIYPYGARAIAYNRKGKLPYNGINELLPGFGKFSIVDIVTPYQVFYNIVAYHREMTLAKNKLNILMMAKSLLGKKPEETIYKMLADGILYIDDTNDQGMLRAQQVRILQTNIGDYLTQLGNLLAEIKQAASEQVDMTPQRYGEIANSAGKGVTEEAVMRGSMGTVIIEFMMDCMRERDYNRDMDYTKLAWIDGLDTSYRDVDGTLKYISLDVDKHIYADYIIKAKNSVKEQDKLRQLQQYAFSAAQNGDNMMAIAAIEGDNVATITKLIKKYQEQKDAHEKELQQLEQQTEQMKQEFELQKIQAKGEEDRKTKELEGYLDQQIELIRADANMISYNAEVGDENKEAGLNRLEAARTRVEQEKIGIERQRNILDTLNKERDRQVKMYDIDTKLKIAKENKNRYDFKSKGKSKK